VDLDRMAQGRENHFTCKDTYVCVFEAESSRYPSFSHAKNLIDGGHWGWWNFVPEWRNEIESMINTRGAIALFAGHLQGIGRRYCAEPNARDGSFANNYIGNNNAESFKLFHRPGSCAHFGY
jgi:hypothetical protein